MSAERGELWWQAPTEVQGDKGEVDVTEVSTAKLLAYFKGEFRNFSVKLEKYVRSPPWMQGLKTGCCHPGAIHSQVHVNFLYSTYKIPSSFHLGFMWRKTQVFPCISRCVGILWGSQCQSQDRLGSETNSSRRRNDPMYINLYLYEFRFMGNKSFLPSVTSEKSRGERDGLYKQSQRLRQHTDLVKTGVRRLCTHEHSGSHLSMLPNAVNPSRDEMALTSTNVSVHGFVVKV